MRIRSALHSAGTTGVACLLVSWLSMSVACSNTADDTVLPDDTGAPTETQGDDTTPTTDVGGETATTDASDTAVGDA